MIYALVLSAALQATDAGCLPERQLTFTARNHDLDNNDNFSPDGRLLVYDTRETAGPGIDHGQTIEVVDIASGKETVIYRPEAIVMGDRPAPGVGAASFSGADNVVAFIHGPPVAELGVRGPYGKPNRNGASVRAEAGCTMSWIDYRDIATDRETLPGAHRGGTHRHEYSLDGHRIGFTYDDFLLPEYDRTVGYMEAHPDAPESATHYVALLVPVVPMGTSKPGEIEKAYGDSWVGRQGHQRAFIGVVREDDGESYEESLFVVDISGDVDITTADSGSATRFPSPPKGTSIRRLTHAWAGGIVRGTADGKRIAYYGKDEEGVTQIFVIPPDGSDRDPDPEKRPVQLTRFSDGVESSLRWHPSGNTIYCVTGNAIAVIGAQPGTGFGQSRYLTPKEGSERKNVVVSPDGKRIAYNKAVPAVDKEGKPAQNYAGLDFVQIFLIDLDGRSDGTADECGEAPGEAGRM